MQDSYGNLRQCRARSVILGLKPQAVERIPLYQSLDGEFRARLTRGSARIADSCPSLGLLRIEIAQDDDLAAACGRLGALAEARYAEPDWLGEGGFIPEDTYFSRQWHHQVMETPAAWELSRGSAAMTVAILDSGIDPDHPEFTGRILPGHDFVNKDAIAEAEHPHGIFTAGLLAANAGNHFQVAGMDHFAMIIPVKILDKNNLGTEWALVQGLTWIVDKTAARVISMSLINFPDSNALKDALRFAREKGIVLVACAGNSGPGDADHSWPGASPLCITVGSTTSEDQRASFSGTGNALDVMAPGKNVETVSQDAARDGTALFSGCSAATPLVAGLASLLLSLDPTLTPEEVQILIERGAEDMIGGSDDVPGWDIAYGWGRVNARRSMELLNSQAGQRFLRGDPNADGILDVSDAITILLYLFADGATLSCDKAADGDDNGWIDITDAIAVLGYLFISGNLPTPTGSCGYDFTADGLDCKQGCTR